MPSNLIDEAIVILKTNKDAKKLEYIENSTKFNYKENTKNKDYVIKEAESVISNYISKIENNKTSRITNKSIDKKYKRLRGYSVIVSIILIFCLIKTLT